MIETRSPARMKSISCEARALAGSMKPKKSIEPVVSIASAIVTGLAESPITFDAASPKSWTRPAGAPAPAERVATFTPVTWTS